jgi:RimJ/RimL family protein N-acetyltransferase
MNIRRFDESHVQPLLRLLDTLPEQDRNFIKMEAEDLLASGQWLQNARVRRFVALDDEDLLGEVAVAPGVGWASHVGEIELIVAPAHRRKGVGRALAQAALAEALSLGLTRIYVEVAAEQAGLIAMFERLGFEPEALLRDFVRDQEGRTHDLVVLTNRVDQLWSELLTLGLAQELDAS